jgi:hypothetical protein
VSLKIDVPDGGEDGHIEWEGGPEPSGSPWLPRRVNCFQVKATTLSPERCGREVRRRRSTQLKEGVREVVERNGAYVLFYGRACNSEGVRLRQK